MIRNQIEHYEKKDIKNWNNVDFLLYCLDEYKKLMQKSPSYSADFEEELEMISKIIAYFDRFRPYAKIYIDNKFSRIKYAKENYPDFNNPKSLMFLYNLEHLSKQKEQFKNSLNKKKLEALYNEENIDLTDYINMPLKDAIEKIQAKIKVNNE